MPFEHVTTPLKPRGSRERSAYRIATLDEYDAATERVRELADYPEGTPQADELARLVRAIMEWDEAHDDATSWQ
ncbi:hypothetical protein [Bosea sp. UC22_33]|uniref:hypothetical protein n=1 Tax=Bosea sp. UC22_33 TaxID=3350165 RepID=UPI00366BF490